MKLDKKMMTVQEIDRFDLIEITNANNYGLNMTNLIMDKINEEYGKSALYKFINIQIDFTKFFLNCQQDNLYFDNLLTKDLERKDVYLIKYITDMIHSKKRYL